MVPGDEKVKKLLAVLLVVCIMFSFAACNKVDAVVMPTAMPTVAPTATPTPIPELPEKVGEKGKLSLFKTEIEVMQGECSPEILELVLIDSELKFNFLSTDKNNPLNGISPCNGDLQYGTGNGSGKFGVHAPVSMAPGVYVIEIVVEISVDYYQPKETLSVPMTIIVKEQE